MQSELKVALVQSDLIWESPEQNRAIFSEKISSIKDQVDLIILPEMFTTGFTMNASTYAETMDGETVKWMQVISRSKKSAILGSIIILEDEKYYNRLLFVYPEGNIETYDKRHAFSLAGEDKIFTSGKEKLVLDYKGWKLCPMICYDLRFPVWSRNVENYDVIIYVANWPKPRITAWDALLKARAIENMSYCIGVNRVGEDYNQMEYTGNSAVYDVLGNVISNLKPNREDFEIVTLDKKHIEYYRNKLRFLDDRDTFNLEV